MVRFEKPAVSLGALSLELYGSSGFPHRRILYFPVGKRNSTPI